MKPIRIQRYHAPCGELLLGSFDGKLCLCDWIIGDRRDFVGRRLQRVLQTVYEEGSSDIIEETKRQLDDYFNCRRKIFDIPLLFAGTDFQKRVWRGLLEIPYGKTVSYAALAQRIGCPDSVRAVANANGANAISIIVPCHRVIGNNGSLTGYGGGLPAKSFLLELEHSFSHFNLFGNVFPTSS